VTAAVTEMPLAILSATPLQTEQTGNREITVVTNPDTATMKRYLAEAEVIIARAGYTTIMELVSLGRGAIIIPTPGQTEQEYLGRYLNRRLGFVTVSQEEIRPALAGFLPHGKRTTEAETELPDAATLLEKAMDMLPEKKKE
jgi:UDP-N-acetylglucosamine:LPS N-acetylglucosamine transferase